MNCFFILSSYLLSYRLYADLDKSDHSLKQNFLVLISYFIKRFFRIYVPFVVSVLIYLKCQDMFHLFYKYDTFWSFITLSDHGKNHMWTIAPEIQYYFFVPFYICFVYRLRRFFYLILLLSTVYVVYEEAFAFQFSRYRKGIFFKASILALIMYKLDRSKVFIRLKSLRVFRGIAGFLSILMFYWMVRKFARVYDKKMTWAKGAMSAEYYSMGLFIPVLVGAPNFLTDFLNTSLLRKLGKYSFGIYLFHPLCIDFVSYQSTLLRYKGPFIVYHRTLFGSSVSATETLCLVFLYAYLCGYLFFHLIERPSIKLGFIIHKKALPYIESFGSKSSKFSEVRA